MQNKKEKNYFILPIFLILLIVGFSAFAVMESNNKKVYIESKPTEFYYLGAKTLDANTHYYKNIDNGKIFLMSAYSKDVNHELLKNNEPYIIITLYVNKFHYKESIIESFLNFLYFVDENGIQTHTEYKPKNI
jgi:hypothetical protein